MKTYTEQDLRLAFRAGINMGKYLEAKDKYYKPIDEEDFKQDQFDNPSKYSRHKWGIKITAPTIAEVIIWLHEKHGIWISINPMHTDGLWGYEISVFCNEPYKGWFSEIKNYTFNSPIEAYEAAIKYTLNNLI